jgi:hypothetical protein
MATQHLTENLTTSTVQQHIDNGFTKELATRWRDFYVNVAARDPSNNAAIARVQYLDKFLSLAQ